MRALAEQRPAEKAHAAVLKFLLAAGYPDLVCLTRQSFACRRPARRAYTRVHLEYAPTGRQVRPGDHVRIGPVADLVDTPPWGSQTST